MNGLGSTAEALYWNIPSILSIMKFERQIESQVNFNNQFDSMRAESPRASLFHNFGRMAPSAWADLYVQDIISIASIKVSAFLETHMGTKLF
jgi:hypothetical protein